jgi:catechol 2,3-dioxygenase-like lactoylglutathione lyase family enzyme
MTVDGIDYVYLETRNWGRSVRFWQSLGFELVLDLGSSGRLAPPSGGAGVWLEEVSPETPLASGVYLAASDEDFGSDAPVERVGDAIESHWGTRLQIVRDPDGREFILQHSPDR